MTYTQTTLLVEYLPVDILKMVDAFLILHNPVFHTFEHLAHKGNLKGVKWVHKYRPHERCTTKAMNHAAMKGHLGVVKWLHKNREEGCTSYAINSAALNGHLEVVKFLNENRQQNGSLKTAINFAAMNNHTDIIDYSHQQNSRK